jgi:hypothetical protein
MFPIEGLIEETRGGGRGKENDSVNNIEILRLHSSGGKGKGE